MHFLIEREGRNGGRFATVSMTQVPFCIRNICEELFALRIMNIEYHRKFQFQNYDKTKLKYNRLNRSYILTKFIFLK